LHVFVITASNISLLAYQLVTTEEFKNKYFAKQSKFEKEIWDKKLKGGRQ